MDPEIYTRGGPNNVFFSHQHILQRVVWNSLEKQLDPWGPIASRRGSVPEFLRKLIAACDLGPDPLSPPPLSIHPWVTSEHTHNSSIPSKEPNLNESRKSSY